MAISYNKTNWVNNETKLNAENLNHIEDGIKNVTDEVNKIEDGTVVAEKAYKDGQGLVIHETYETKDAANAKLTEAKTYADGKIEELDVAEAGSDGSYIEKISETNGKIAVTVQEFDSTPTNNSNKGVKSGGVKLYVDNAIADLDATEVGGNGKYVKAISETNGKISATEETMDTTPTNGSNKAITSGAVKEYVDGTLENYAKKDGYYETFGYAREAGIARNLQNDEGKLLDPDTTTSSSTIYADQPFTQRATAMTMNAYLDNELITVGSGYEQWKKEQAFSIVRNQYRKVKTVTNAGITLTLTADGTLIIGGTSTTGSQWSMNFIEDVIPKGHKYLLWHSKKSEYLTGWFAWNNNTAIIRNAAYGIFELNNDANDIGLSFQIPQGTTIPDNTIAATNIVIIDLTQWFASRPEIATALNGDAGVKWFLQNYPEALTLGYDEGTIVDTEDYEYQTTGVNLWDEEWELGDIGSNGENATGNFLRSKGYIDVFPNTDYYQFVGFRSNNAVNIYIHYYDINKKQIGYPDVTENIGWKQYKNNDIFKTPKNCYYIRFSLGATYGTTYNNDIQICQHFTETSVEQTYHKYEIFKDRVSWAFTSTGKGKSAGKVADTKDYVNKKNIEKVGRVDLGTLDWIMAEYNSRYLFYASNSSQKINTNNYLCSKYISTDNIYTIEDKCITGSGGAGSSIWVRDDSYTDVATFKAAMSGVYLNYELATPVETDMSGDELDTNIPENDYGVERKVPLSGNMFSGSSTTIFYQDNVLRQIYNNKSSIDNLQTDLSTEETTRSDSDTALQNAIGGTLRQCLCVKENIDFDNTAFVDLGELTWVYEGNVFSANLLSVGDKGLSTKYKRVDTVATENQPNNTIQVRTNIMYIKDATYTDATTFKNAMKGVLLAYEKASS